MARPDEDDREAIDRAFAEMVAGYHLTADRPDPLTAEPIGTERAEAARAEPTRLDPTAADQTRLDPTRPEARPEPTDIPGSPTDGWAADPMHFRMVERPFDPPPPRVKAGAGEAEAEERYVPEPLPPLRRPAWPALLGWLGIGYAVLVVLAAIFGFRGPPWIGWLAVAGFIGGFAVLVARLPRDRPPDAGNGAVV